MLSVGQRAEGIVDGRLQFIHIPVHRHPTAANDLSHFSMSEIVGAVFLQPAIIRVMAALHRNDDHLCMGTVHVFFHAPAFAVRSVFIKKDIVPVKHV